MQKHALPFGQVDVRIAGEHALFLRAPFYAKHALRHTLFRRASSHAKHALLVGLGHLRSPARDAHHALPVGQLALVVCTKPLLGMHHALHIRASHALPVHASCPAMHALSMRAPDHAQHALPHALFRRAPFHAKPALPLGLSYVRRSSGKHAFFWRAPGYAQHALRLGRKHALSRRAPIHAKHALPAGQADERFSAGEHALILRAPSCAKHALPHAQFRRASFHAKHALPVRLSYLRSPAGDAKHALPVGQLVLRALSYARHALPHAPVQRASTKRSRHRWTLANRDHRTGNLPCLGVHQALQSTHSCLDCTGHKGSPEMLDILHGRRPIPADTQSLLQRRSPPQLWRREETLCWKTIARKMRGNCPAWDGAVSSSVKTMLTPLQTGTPGAGDAADWETAEADAAGSYIIAPLSAACATSMRRRTSKDGCASRRVAERGRCDLMHCLRAPGTIDFSLCVSGKGSASSDSALGITLCEHMTLLEKSLRPRTSQAERASPQRGMWGPCVPSYCPRPRHIIVCSLCATATAGTGNSAPRCHFYVQAPCTSGT
jgi:hypothetical protein